MVYIDNFNAPFRNMVMCHMVADTTKELLAMVDIIGVQKKWIQYPGTYNEHFDISLAKKALAIKAGAVEIAMRDYARFANAKKTNEVFIPPPLNAVVATDTKQPTMTDRIIYFTDPHINKYSQHSEHVDRLGDCLKIVDDAFKFAKAYESDTILLGGDLGDLPKWVYITVLNRTLARFAKLFKKYPKVKFYAISGNHDHNTKNFWDNPADTYLAAFVTAFPDRFILLDNMIIGINEHNFIAGIPYYEHKTCFDQALDSMQANVILLRDKFPKAKVTLLIHQTPEGQGNKHIKSDTFPTDPRYKVFDLIACGHIHTSQRLTDKFFIGGNPNHRDLGDIGKEKGMWTWELSNPVATLEFLSRKGRYPEFVRMNTEDITDEAKQTAFVVPNVDAKAIVVEGSADAALFASNLQPSLLLRNFWQTVEGTDEKLLDVGLSLCGI